MTLPAIDTATFEPLFTLSRISLGSMSACLGLILYNSYQAYHIGKHFPSTNQVQSSFGYGSDSFGYRQKYNKAVSNIIGGCLGFAFSTTSFCLSHFYNKKTLPTTLLISSAVSLVLVGPVTRVALDIKYDTPERG